jgi:uncharacterized glyoxalase superfamily protein PhnB
MEITQAIPLLRVADIERTMAWYQEVLGFKAEPFFEPPYVFVILDYRGTKVMARRVDGFQRDPESRGWDLYITLVGGNIRKAHADLQAKGVVVRELQRMPYGDCEFEVRDPDGYVLCISELLEDPSGIPLFREEE